MRIEIVYFEGCPNWRLAHERVLEALAGLGRADVPVELHLVKSPDEALAAGMHGSPTILLDGRDPFPNGDESVWSCRLYRTDAGMDGAPSTTALMAVIG